MKQHDRVFGLIWFLLGTGIFAGSIKLGLGALHEPGPGFFLFLVGAVLMGVSLILIYYSATKGVGKREQLKEKKGIQKSVEKKWKNFAFVLLALFGYSLALETLGFYSTTFLFLFSLFELKNFKKWLWPLITTIITVVLCYLILELALGCQFPRGILGLR